MRVSDVLKLPADKLTDGEVGIEVEVEGRNLPKTDAKIWVMTRDGSLKADEAIEYVLARPMSREDAMKALKYLDSKYESVGSTVDESIRAGVHVHVNVQSMNMCQLYTFITLYLVFEHLLVRWCGPTREGNLFCLRASDAEYLLHRLGKAARTRRFHEIFYDDDLRYASVNVKAVVEHGSLEFRSMRGTRDLKAVARWVALLLNLRSASLSYPTPISVVEDFSHLSSEVFVKKIFGADGYEEIFPKEDGASLLFKGMRCAQDVAYAVEDWAALASLGSTNPFKKGEFTVCPDPLEFDGEKDLEVEASGPNVVPDPTWRTLTPAMMEANMGVMGAVRDIARATVRDRF
jgi:hypothetical protein